MGDGQAEIELKSSPFFTGSIGEAIKFAKSEKRSLVVYCSEENEDCLRMDQTTWKDSKVQMAIREQFVTIRLEQRSTDAAYFFAIYPYYVVPNVSIINSSGRLLKQLGGYVSAEELLGMFEQCKAMQTAATIVAALASASTGSTALPTTRSQATDLASVSTSSTAFPKQSQDSNPSDALKNLDSENDSSAMHEDSEASSLSASRTEEKLENVTSEQDHQVSSQVNGSDAVLEAREEGCRLGLQKQATSVAESGTSEAKTEQALDLPACDPSFDETTCRNVTSSRDLETENNKQSVNTDFFVSLPETTSPCQQEEPQKRLQVANTFLIQVRLTSGKSIRKTFNPRDTLAAVKEFVDQNRDDGDDAYSLAKLYPRKVFGQEDMEKSLVELSLEDRATLILVTSPSLHPKAQARERSDVQDATQSKDAGIYGGIWKLFSYLNPLSYFSGSSNTPSNAESGSSSWQYEPNANLRNSLRHGAEKVNPNADESNASNRKKGQGSSWGGNIHTLEHNDNNDVFKRGNAFWNGNSTQFGDDPQK